MPRPIGVFACDSYGATRMGIQSILDQEGIQVLGTATTVAECVSSAPHDAIAVYILGLNQSDPPAAALIQALQNQHSDAGIIAYGTDTHPRVVRSIYMAGAKAYVVKSGEPEVLIEAVRTVAAGDHYWPPGIAEDIATFFVTGEYLSNPKHLLTTSELKLFILIAQGIAPAEAANRLGIASTTARNRAVTIRKKLRIGRDEFSRLAEKYNLL